MNRLQLSWQAVDDAFSFSAIQELADGSQRYRRMDTLHRI